jgi:NAD(P)-dependent dehydrogenase (short-subunit alcohol dehydrogenase family)
VVVNYLRGTPAAERVAESIRSCGSRALIHRADVSSEEQVREMFEQMFATFGTIDILINNAGL